MEEEFEYQFEDEFDALRELDDGMNVYTVTPLISFPYTVPVRLQSLWLVDLYFRQM